MSRDRNIKPVSFSKKKTDEQEMLNYVKGMDFSNYVKRLIFSDMRREATVPKYSFPDYQDENEDISSYL